MSRVCAYVYVLEYKVLQICREKAGSSSICLWDVPASKLGQNTGYPQALHGYRQFIQANSGNAP